jgi:hypothetical protein
MGSTKVQAIIDPDNRIKESNERNNKAVAYVTVNAAMLAQPNKGQTATALKTKGKVQKAGQKKLNVPKMTTYSNSSNKTVVAKFANQEKTVTNIRALQKRDLTGAKSIFSYKKIDKNEPGNNKPGGAANATFTGNTSDIRGEVGSVNDGFDYFYIKSGSSGYGTIFKITRTSGEVQLHLSDRNDRYLDWDNNIVWIAVEPNTKFYVGVKTTLATSTKYTVNVVSRPLIDPTEPNNSFKTAKTYTKHTNRILTDLVSKTGIMSGVGDYYKFILKGPKLVRVTVSNAGLEPGKKVEISLLDKSERNFKTVSGGSDGATLEYDLRPDYGDHNQPSFPVGEWRIFITTYYGSTIKGYGTGNPPRCYTNPSGYILDLVLIE